MKQQINLNYEEKKYYAICEFEPLEISHVDVE